MDRFRDTISDDGHANQIIPPPAAASRNGKMKRSPSSTASLPSKKHRIANDDDDGDGLDIGACTQRQQHVFDPYYASTSFVARFSAAFKQGDTFEDAASKARIVADPFPTATLPNFLTSREFLESLKNELLEETYYHKSNDLYEFYQTDDLRLSRKPHVVALKEAFYSRTFLESMTALTGLELDPSVIDLNGNQYTEGCYLLCHDDDIRSSDAKGRRIAFILYLVDEDWCETDGGLLELFRCVDAERAKRPEMVATSLIPQYNSLVFFALSPTSYHQVTEILSPIKNRVSISGWFHGPLPRKSHELTTTFTPPVSAGGDDGDGEALCLESFVNPDYLTSSARARVMDTFVDDSSVELQRFLREDVYQQLISEMLGDGDVVVAWTQDLGLPHVRRCSRWTRSVHEVEDTGRSTPLLLARLERLFRTAGFADYLASLTNLEIDGVSTEVRQFGSGDYTLLNDHHVEPEGLDVVFSFPSVDAWPKSWSGATHYVADKETLLTLWPRPNTLTLVYRNEGTMRFVKYLNSRAGGAKRRELSALYAVRDEGGGDGEEEKEEESEDDDDDDDEASERGSRAMT